jgi:hypothetical protein
VGVGEGRPGAAARRVLLIFSASHSSLRRPTCFEQCVRTRHLVTCAVASGAGTARSTFAAARWVRFREAAALGNSSRATVTAAGCSLADEPRSLHLRALTRDKIWLLRRLVRALLGLSTVVVGAFLTPTTGTCRAQRGAAVGRELRNRLTTGNQGLQDRGSTFRESERRAGATPDQRPVHPRAGDAEQLLQLVDRVLSPVQGHEVFFLASG